MKRTSKLLPTVCAVVLLVVLSQNWSGTAAAQSTPPPSTLRDAAQKRGLLIGAAVRSELLDEPSYARTLAAQFNVLVAENDMKFESVQPSEGRFDFSRADKIVAFAEKNKMRVRGHTLVWHSQVSKWVSESRCKDAEKILQAHITGVAGHFKGKVFAWDVVNEALADDGTMRNTFWLRCVGADYIEKAFRWAHAADPQAKLFLNDYEIERPGAKANRAFALVRDLKAKGVPIDGIGLQMHLDRIPADVFLASYMQKFADIGIDVHITEMDVRLPQPASSQGLALQADAYRMTMRRCLQAMNCKAFLTWGVTDRYSWIPEFFTGFGSALLFDKGYQPKLAFRAVMNELSK